MTEQKKNSGTKSRLSKAKIKAALHVEREEPKDKIFYVRVKACNVQFMKSQASASGLSLSKYTDKVLDNLRGV